MLYKSHWRTVALTVLLPLRLIDYGLRDYGTARWEGGDSECDHSYKRGGNGAASTKQVTSAGTQEYQYQNVCKRCGAVRIDNQIGLEETPEMYVEKLVAVFREVRRVLSSAGTLWLNLGDSYAGSGGAGGDYNEGGLRKNQPKYKSNWKPETNLSSPKGLKPKDLMGIPWMVAFALRADGWYLRSEIIWHKPNPMPESVTDRPTKAHEQIFLLSKSARYYYDAEAIKEESIGENRDGFRGGDGRPYVHDNAFENNGRKTSKYSFARKVNEEPPPGKVNQHRPDREDIEYNGKRNRRSVWTVATAPYSGAHFATYPPALIEPCIKAGCPEGGIVLDPFSGSGTTAMVARKLGRHAIGLDLSLSYIQECARPRLQLSDLEEWENGKKAESNHSDLPLFMEAP
jgi:DNA modification methylase